MNIEQGKGGEGGVEGKIACRHLWEKKRDSRAKQGMIVGEEEIERKVEREGWTHRGALHFDVRMSCIGCQYTHTHTHTQTENWERMPPRMSMGIKRGDGRKETMQAIP